MAEDMTGEELVKLAAIFKEMGVKPKCDTPGDLKQWMTEFCKSTDEDKEPTPAAVGTSTKTMYTQPQLRMSTFSGEPSKTDVAYDVWRFEVDCMLSDQTYSAGQIMQAARKSLKGEASGIAMRLGPTATIQDLLKKLEGAYGTVEMSETLMSQFYSTQQQEGENVTAWSCRIEGILDKARQHGKVKTGDMEEMLRSKFWTGLNEQLKNSSRHKFDTVKSFDQLKIQIRAIEHELQTSRPKDPSQLTEKPQKSNKAQVKAAVSSPTESTEMQELKGMIQSLTSKVDAVDKEMQALRKANPKGKTDKPAEKEGAAANPQLPADTQRKNFQEGCWHCGRKGHIKRNCKILMEQIQQFEQFQRQQQQQPLNMMGPTSWSGWSSPNNQAPEPHQQQYHSSWWESQQRPQSK